jgi:SAM-dependent methyltransferase
MPPENSSTSIADPKYNFLFVVTYGRSGSTLLQGVLNSFDGYCIRGENANLLVTIFRMWRECRLIREQFGETQTGSVDSWFGADFVEPDAFAERMISAFKDCVLRPPERAKVIGYKEIRYTYEFFKRGEFAEYFEFIDELFPRSAFIFNSRKLSSVVQSGWWKYDPEAMDELQTTERIMVSTYNRFKHKSIWLRYEEYANDPEGFRGLTEFLGEPFDRERISAIMAIPHSFATRDEKDLVNTSGDILVHERSDKFLVPPRELLAPLGSTPETFVANGDGFTTEYLIRRASLKPNESVLDLYCGFGQKAQALVRYLDEDGRYEGLATGQEIVDWCQSAYSHHQNFHFTLAETIPFGFSSIEAGIGDFQLPYPDEQFDVVVCDELFLRLPPAGLAKCVSEIARVLKRNGRCVATTFLLTSETTAIASSSKGIISFPFEGEGYRISSLDDLTPAVAIQEDVVRAIFSQCGMRVCEIIYGYWANTPDLLQALHDCVVATKQKTSPLS